MFLAILLYFLLYKNSSLQNNNEYTNAPYNWVSETSFIPFEIKRAQDNKYVLNDVYVPFIEPKDECLVIKCADVMYLSRVRYMNLPTDWFYKCQ